MSTEQDKNKAPAAPSQEDEKQALDKKIKELKDSKFKQQMLPAWRPVPSFASTMITFGIFGIVFLAIGIMLYVMSDKIQESEMKYAPDMEDECPMYDPELSEAEQPLCRMTLELEETMTAPIFVYYQLENFYQNHRRYVKSRDYKQLMGFNEETDNAEEYVPLTVDDVESSCDPIITNADLANMGIKYYYWTEDGGFSYNQYEELDPEQLATPCGLIAKSMFNDTFALWEDEAMTQQVTIVEDGIAWQSDIDYKFNNAKDWKETKTQWWDMTDEHFIVWMRTAGLPNFRKLWGKINEDLTGDKYYVQIKNTYNVKDFSGTKSFVLSTTNMLGGKNYFLAVCYIVVGALCIVFAVIFFVAYMRKRSYNAGQ